MRLARMIRTVMVLGAIVCALPSCVPQTEGDSGQSTVDVRGVELRSLLSDATAVHYDTGHGTQVEYMSADGLAYLWYPGNRSIVPGEWHVRIGPRPLGPGPESRNAIGPYAVFEQDPTQPVESTLYICFRYGPDTYNPVTRMRGGNWECSISPANEEWERRTHPGDPFGLSEIRQVPAVLERGTQFTFDDLNRIVEK